MSDIILKSKDIVRDFDTSGGIVHVLKGISVEIPKGKLTIFKGRSGSGKTTLINMLGALDYPTSGNIWFKDRDITKLSTPEQDNMRRTEYGFVFQSTALVGMMSAYEKRFENGLGHGHTTRARLHRGAPERGDRS